MAKLIENLYRHRMIVSLIVGTVVFFPMLFMALNVVHDLRLLNSAMSNNAQWSLAQAEVEFLELDVVLEEGAAGTDPDLAEIRQKFDIFYSRADTLNTASVFDSLREVPEVADHIATINAFLDAAVDIMDAPDETLRSALVPLAGRAADLGPTVRALSNTGLAYFAQESDDRRRNVSTTLIYLAVGVTVLLAILLFLTAYMAYLNHQNERRRKEAIEAYTRMNVVTSTALDGIIISNIYGRILDFNSAASQIFGYAEQVAIGRNLGDLVIPDHRRDEHESSMENLRRGGQRRYVGKGRVKMELKRANGENFPAELAIQSAHTDQGEIFVTVLRDISHRIAAEKDLITARDRALSGEKAKTEFLATMSHEIRTPLNGLLGNLTLLGDTALDDKQMQYLRNMETSGKLLMQHVSDVLDITKYDAGKMQLTPETMSFSALIQDIVDNQSGAALANNTALAWTWSGRPTDWIFADKNRLQNVFMNIIGNAVKFSPGGSVMITLSAGDLDDATPYLKITVADTGLGISDDAKPHIFDDFMTGDTSYGRAVGGTGLGLGIAKRFVVSMDGTIDVESSLGKGTIFTICLPVTLAQAPAAQWPEKQNTNPQRSGHILLVEDNEINRFVAREMLTAEGHKVSEAVNGKIAVDLVAREDFDLVLMDISMPVMDGRTATQTIRAMNAPSSDVPIIALTANAMPDEQKAFLADGMNAILSKPLSRGAMLDLLAQYLGGHVADHADTAQVDKDLDMPHIEELIETLGPDAFRSLLRRFVDDIEDALGQMQPSQGGSDIAEHAHRVAGSAATFGATGLQAALIHLENTAKQGIANDIENRFESVQQAWTKTRAAFAETGLFTPA